MTASLPTRSPLRSRTSGTVLSFDRAPANFPRQPSRRRGCARRPPAVGHPQRSAEAIPERVQRPDVIVVTVGDPTDLPTLTHGRRDDRIGALQGGCIHQREPIVLADENKR